MLMDCRFSNQIEVQRVRWLASEVRQGQFGSLQKISLEIRMWMEEVELQELYSRAFLEVVGVEELWTKLEVEVVEEH